ncbi:MAG: hypothetical protein KDC87_09580 [Planctomycetes bacterium]|nr:hypothetical protein [Planctomycetota bacterium]
MASAQAVQLRGGDILVGEIKDWDGQGFVLVRTDNGGELKLRWSHLTQGSAKLLRTKLGLLTTEVGEVTVRADVVRYRGPSGTPDEVVGRRVKDDRDFIYVQRCRDVTKISKSDVLGFSERQVTPFEVFTVADYYNDQVAEFAPGEDADKHLALAEKLMRVRDYEHAEKHMLEAKKLGGGRQPKVLEQRLQHLVFLKGAKEEQGLLDEIRTATNRGEFKRAAEKIAAFKEKYPSSKLGGELERLEKGYTQTRERVLTRDVARLWYKYIQIFAARKVGESKVTLALAKQYAERMMGKEIREKIAAARALQTDEVEAMWKKRDEVAGAIQQQHYYYSMGSWVLGEKEVLKGTKQGEAEAKQAKTTKDTKETELEQMLKRRQEALRRAREAAKKGRRGGGPAGKGQADVKKEVTPEDWWNSADRHAKVSWLKAYYAEFSGDMTVTGAFVTPCTMCAGAGRVASQSSNGGDEYRDCPLCHKTRYTRDIRAK